MARNLRRVFHGCRMMFYVVMPLTLLVMIGVGILYVRLRHGPISFDFVVAPIERGINAELISSSVKIDGAELRLGRAGELEFRLRDVSVLEGGGDVGIAAKRILFAGFGHTGHDNLPSFDRRATP